MILSGFKSAKLKPLTGKTLAEVAAMRGTSPEETAMDLVIEDGSRVGTVYFLMSEDNVREQIQLPWMSFGSDAASQAPEGVFLKSSAHPRTYGNFARLLGRYVRDEKLITLRGSGAPADRPSRAQSGDQGSRRAETRHIMPTSSSSIRQRSPTWRRLKSRINMQPACAMCSSTASRCCAAANIAARHPAGRCAGRAGTAAAEAAMTTPKMPEH